MTGRGDEAETVGSPGEAVGLGGGERQGECPKPGRWQCLGQEREKRPVYSISSASSSLLLRSRAGEDSTWFPLHFEVPSAPMGRLRDKEGGQMQQDQRPGVCPPGHLPGLPLAGRVDPWQPHRGLCPHINKRGFRWPLEAWTFHPRTTARFVCALWRRPWCWQAPP